MATSAPSRADLHRLIDELPEEALRPLTDLLEDAVDDVEAAKKALADPERIPYEQVRRESRSRRLTLAVEYLRANLVLS